MPTPKRKQSRSRRNSRSANKHIIPKPFSLCKEEGCGTPTVSHRVCAGCGFYNGKKVITVKARKDNIIKSGIEQNNLPAVQG
jgi:large subunit ribosomal protein L32